MRNESRLQCCIKSEADLVGINSVSNARYNWLLTSPQDARDINKYLLNSLLVCLSNPSAIFELIDREALNIWSRKKNVLQFLNSVNRSLFNFLASFHTMRSSNLCVLVAICDSVLVCTLKIFIFLPFVNHQVSRSKPLKPFHPLSPK